MFEALHSEYFTVIFPTYKISQIDGNLKIGIFNEGKKT